MSGENGSSKRKVCVISASAIESPPKTYGALERVAWDSAVELGKEFDTTLVAAKGSQVPPGCQLIETVEPSYGMSEEAAWEVYRDKLQDFACVVDHSHFKFSWKAKGLYPHLKNIAVFHDLMVSRMAPPTGSFDRLYGVSDWHGRYLSQEWLVDVGGLPNGVPVQDFQVQETKGNYILFLSRIDRLKGAHKFLGLVQSLKCPAIMAGEDSPERGIDPAYRDIIISTARNLGVDYRGRVSDAEKKELIANARAMVVPLDDPYKEVFGVWAVEALASGTPCFTTARGATSEIISPDVGAVRMDVVDLVGPLQRFLQGNLTFDPQACRRRAETFGLGPMGERYRAAIREVLNGS